MSSTSPPNDNAPATFQFQFQQPYNAYPVSQAQQNYQQLATQQAATPTPPAAPSTTATIPTTPQPSAPAAPSTSGTATGSSTQSQAQSQSQTQTAQPQQSRSAAEQARKDRTLAEFMLMLDDYEPLIPNEVTDYYLQRVGFETEDVRLKRLLALAAQKFVSDIAADAFQHARIRTNAASTSRGRVPMGQSSRDKSRTMLTMEDLSAALAEYGINARKPEFYM